MFAELFTGSGEISEDSVHIKKKLYSGHCPGKGQDWRIIRESVLRTYGITLTGITLIEIYGHNNLS
jgi:NADPH-dependent 2,4-dienoyl-CoA reductase/sulfur reductase-like enzyme